MTRSMGDAIGGNAAALVAYNPDVFAVYVTGPGIAWTPGQLALIPAGRTVVTIDQGAAGSPVASANIRDVETGAWSPGSAVTSEPWTAARPTIYCNRSALPAVLEAGWRGDLWLAIPGWQPGQALPSAPGCTIVAVQNVEDAGGGAYDESVIIDPTWPLEADMAVTVIPGFVTCSKCSAVWYSPTAGGNVCPAGGTHSTPSDWAQLVQLSGS